MAEINPDYADVYPDIDETHGELKTVGLEFSRQYDYALLKAVQELSAKNDALEARIAELEGKL